MKYQNEVPEGIFLVLLMETHTYVVSILHTNWNKADQFQNSCTMLKITKYDKYGTWKQIEWLKLILM